MGKNKFTEAQTVDLLVHYPEFVTRLTTHTSRTWILGTIAPAFYDKNPHLMGEPDSDQIGRAKSRAKADSDHAFRVYEVIYSLLSMLDAI